MTSAAEVIKGIGPKLVPFFKTLAIYFVVFIPHDQPSILAMILKCLPIVGLIVFVILQTKSSGSEYQYSKTMIQGLFFCLLGDAFLVWPKYFDIGAACFLIGHVNYIKAFGFKQPLNLTVGVPALAVGVAGTLFLWPNLKGVQIIGVPIYSLTIMIMVWRAATNFQYAEESWSWSRLYTLLGGISFAVSDLCVGIDHFHGSFNYAQLLIMTTYYGAQLGITLSVLDAKIEPSTLNVISDKENRKAKPKISSN